MMLHKPPLVLTVLAIACFTAACSSKSVLNEHQLHNLLQCPCPTIAPLASYTIPGEVPFAGIGSAYMGGMVTGPDGNLWVTEYDAGKVARVTESGQVTEYSVPDTGAGPALITTGSAGSNTLWFTDYNQNIIRSITTAGQITDYSLPPYSLATGNLQAIILGPDGNMWFSHDGANIIGVMSPSGSLLNTYNIPTANSDVTFLIVGPDSNIWFVEEGASKIGRITLSSGQIDEFPTPTANSKPKNLIIGADGNMWFPESVNGTVARITTAGVITEFQIESSPATVLIRRVTTTADGSIWFIAAASTPPFNQSEVGQMNTSGVGLNMWAFPTGWPQGLTMGPEGSPWFTDEANAAVVRL